MVAHKMPLAKYDGTTGKFAWPVGKSLGDKAIYGIQIFWEEDARVFQYSFPFQIAGGASGSPSGSAWASASVTVTPTGNSTLPSSTRSASPTLIPPHSNLTTTAHTTLVVATTAPGSKTTAVAPPAQTNAAVPAVGSTLALLGGLAMAVFAL